MNINRINNNKILKRIVRILVLSIIICLSSIYEAYKYNKFIDAFKTNFNDYEFSEANNLLLTKETFNPFKLFMMNNDVSQYINTKINTLSEDIKNKNISSEDALNKFLDMKLNDLFSSKYKNEIKASYIFLAKSLKTSLGSKYFLTDNS